MTGFLRGCAVTAAMLATAGCGLLPDAYSSCEEPQPYQSAQDGSPLQVPTGAEMPDTRNALRIPEVKSPERPVDADACLDHPPDYSAPAQRDK